MLYARKKPEASLRLRYRKNIEIGLVIGLGVLLIMFQASKRADREVEVQKELDFKIEVDEIPQTEQMKRPPAPSRPSIPIESEDEDQVIFSFRLHPTYEFKSLVLSLGKDGEVLEPLSLRNELYRELQQMIGKYQ